LRPERFSRRVEVVTDFLDSIGDLDFDSMGEHLAERCGDEQLSASFGSRLTRSVSTRNT